MKLLPLTGFSCVLEVEISVIITLDRLKMDPINRQSHFLFDKALSLSKVQQTVEILCII